MIFEKNLKIRKNFSEWGGGLRTPYRFSQFVTERISVKRAITLRDMANKEKIYLIMNVSYVIVNTILRTELICI